MVSANELAQKLKINFAQERVFKFGNLKDLNDWMLGQTSFLDGMIQVFGKNQDVDVIEFLHHKINQIYDIVIPQLPTRRQPQEHNDVEASLRSRWEIFKSALEDFYEELQFELEGKFNNYKKDIVSSIIEQDTARFKKLLRGQFDQEIKLESIVSEENVGSIDVRDTKELDNKVAAIDEKQKNLSIVVEQLRKDNDEFLKEVKDTADKAKGQSDEAKGLSEAYKTELGVHDAFMYWKKKASSHKRYFVGWLLLAVAWLVFGLYFLNGPMLEYRNNISNADNVFDILPYLPYTVLLVILFVWGLRFILRFVMSENHLSNRADEKAVFIQTYIALEKKQYVKEDLELILGPIFSHSEDGIVKDDGLPTQAIMDRITGK